MAKKTEQPLSEWLSVKDVCQRAHIGRSLLYAMWTSGEGPRYSQLPNGRLVKAGWLEDWLLAQEHRRQG